MDKEEPVLMPNKHVRGSFTRPMGAGEAMREAKGTPMYWWFKTLQASDEYRLCCRNQGKGKLANLYKDFGDVDEKSFAQWYQQIGRKLFAEKKRLKKVEPITEPRQLGGLNLDEDVLIIKVPLTLRRQTAIRQIGKELQKAYENRNPVDIWEQSSAKRQIVKTKIRMSTVEKKANIQIDLRQRNAEIYGDDDALEIRRMTFTVSRYLGQAKHLIANAELGVFPSIKPPAKT
jgi:hypothetical protein